MARFVLLAIVAVCYLALAGATFAFDVRLGVATLALIGLREAGEAAKS